MRRRNSPLRQCKSSEDEINSEFFNISHCVECWREVFVKSFKWLNANFEQLKQVKEYTDSRSVFPIKK